MPTKNNEHVKRSIEIGRNWQAIRLGPGQVQDPGTQKTEQPPQLIRFYQDLETTRPCENCD